jgi:4-hydroxy-3-methylbut-2-en-1-yl diphosphate reductase
MYIGEIERLLVPDHDKIGFCKGVEAADRTLRLVTEVALSEGIETVYGYHEVVHNRNVAKSHEDNGVVFVQDVGEIPEGSVVVGSAHGTSEEVKQQVARKNGLFLDAVCPLVIHTHKAVEKARINGGTVVYFVKDASIEDPSKIHDEVIGTLGYMDHVLKDGTLVEDRIPRLLVTLDEDPAEISSKIIEMGSTTAYLIGQTTLNGTRLVELKSVVEEELRIISEGTFKAERIESRDVCFAVDERQQGVRELMAENPDTIIVVTDPNSSNGKGYAKLAEEIALQKSLDTNVVMIEEVSQIPDGLRGIVAVTASASTPDYITREIIVALGGTADALPETRSAFNLTRIGDSEQIRNKIRVWKETLDDTTDLLR